MPSLTTISNNKYFTIEHDDDALQVALFDDLVQVAGVFIPDDGTGSAIVLANQIGRLYGNPIPSGNH